MEIKETFKIYVEITDQKKIEGFLCFELNGVKYVNPNIYYDVKDALITFQDTIYKKNENFSSVFYNLNKDDIIHLFNCYYGVEEISDYLYLKAFEKEFEERLGSLMIYPGHYAFDTFGVWHIKGEESEKVIFCGNDSKVGEEARFYHNGFFEFIGVALKKLDLIFKKDTNNKLINYSNNLILLAEYENNKIY